MAISGDVIPQDGGQAKLHPYLVALVRWCVSCLWSTATILLHRLIMKPLPQLSGASKSSKPRPAGREHLHPEPRVECVVLHQPADHGLDVIFVHGLYGSLGNTWRQGEWKSKYQISPEKKHIKRPTDAPAPCLCSQCQTKTNLDNNNDQNRSNNGQNNNNNGQNSNDNGQNSSNNDKNNSNNDISDISGNNNFTCNNYEDNMTIFEPDDFENGFNINNDNYDNAFTNMDEKFYKNFKEMLPKDDVFITEKFYNNTLLDQVEIIDNYETQAQFVSDLFKNCDSGRENTKNNKQGNRNESNNEENRNNNDENKNNNESFDCKCEKKCEMGCGCICDDCYSPCWPKDWIKEDYPDARVISINYTSDPHLWRPLWIKENKRLCLHVRAEQMMEQLLALDVGRKPVVWVGHSKGGLFIKQIYCEAYEAYLKINSKGTKETKKESQIITENRNNNCNKNENISNKSQHFFNNEQNRFNKCRNECNISKGKCELNTNSSDCDDSTDNMWHSSVPEEDAELHKKSLLWCNTVGLMLYSVPHRGSPLADIKTPITARSVELIEISKDNALVLSLQERWLRAAAPAPPLVRSLVETRRTLMSVLWLRIVSEDSADPGIGALCGVSVDHREICKPSSRSCLLYTELRDLIQVALNKYNNSI